MATLDARQLAELRRKFVQKLGNVTIDFDKPTLNAAFQAVEDWYEANKADASAAIDEATAPYEFSGTEKKQIAAYFLWQKAAREGA